MECLFDDDDLSTEWLSSFDEDDTISDTGDDPLSNSTSRTAVLTIEPVNARSVTPTTSPAKHPQNNVTVAMSAMVTPTHAETEPNYDRATSVSPYHRQSRSKSPTIQKIEEKHKRTLAKLRRKIKTLHEANYRHLKKIADKDKIIEELKLEVVRQSKKAEPGMEVLKAISLPNRHILERQLKKSPTDEYSEELKDFAFTLSHHSRAAYKFVRSSFDCCLPHPQSLSRWYTELVGAPGCTGESCIDLPESAPEEGNTNSISIYICNLYVYMYIFRNIIGNKNITIAAIST